MKIVSCIVLDVVDTPVEMLGFSEQPTWEIMVYRLNSDGNFCYYLIDRLETPVLGVCLHILGKSKIPVPVFWPPVSDRAFRAIKNIIQRTERTRYLARSLALLDDQWEGPYPILPERSPEFESLMEQRPFASEERLRALWDATERVTVPQNRYRSVIMPPWSRSWRSKETFFATPGEVSKVLTSWLGRRRLIAYDSETHSPMPLSPESFFRAARERDPVIILVDPFETPKRSRQAIGERGVMYLKLPFIGSDESNHEWMRACELAACSYFDKKANRSRIRRRNRHDWRDLVLAFRRLRAPAAMYAQGWPFRLRTLWSSHEVKSWLTPQRSLKVGHLTVGFAPDVGTQGS